MFVRFLFVVLSTLLLAAPAVAQEIEITLEWGGSDGGCNVCGDADYACSGPYGDWNDGQANFVDPLPTGSVLGGVIVVLQGAGEDSTTRVWLSGDPVGGTEIVESPFECDACQPTTFSALGGVWPSYVYGGTNTLWIDTTANPEICVNRAEIVLYYGAGDDDDATGDDDDATGDDDDDDDDSAGDDDDNGGGGGGGGRRRAGCSVADGGSLGAIALLLLAATRLRRRS